MSSDRTVPRPRVAISRCIDFDPCRSVVKAGNSGRYNLKPVILSDGYLDPVMFKKI